METWWHQNKDGSLNLEKVREVLMRHVPQVSDAHFGLDAIMARIAALEAEKAEREAQEPAGRVIGINTVQWKGHGPVLGAKLYYAPPVSDLSQESPLWREWSESRHSVKQMREERYRLRAENARLIADHAAALRLVADVRAAIGDGKRMQPELLEYCRKLLLFARIRFGYAPGDYMHICSGCAASFIADKRAVVCQKCADAAIDAAIGGWNEC